MFIIELAARFGVTGACVLTVIWVFLNYGTLDQKHTFIDKFILLNIKESDNKYVLYIGIILVVLFLIQNLFFRKKDKLRKDRITELERHIQELEGRKMK